MAIRFKLLIPLLIAFVFLIILLHFYWAPQMLNHNKKLIVERETAIMEALTPGIIVALLENNLMRIHDVLNETSRRNRHWVSFTLLNNKSKRIYPLIQPPSKKGEYLIALEKEFFWGNKSFGKMFLVIDWEEELVLHERKIKKLEIFSMILFGLAIVIGLVLQNIWFRKPLLELTSVANQLAKGNFDAQLPPERADEIGELSKSFSAMRESIRKQQFELEENLKLTEETNLRLQQANHHKSQFLSSMSHELRTPLNAVLGFSDLLIGQHFGKLNDKQLGYINQIDSSGKHLLYLIGDLLDVAKIDAGKMRLSIQECLPEQIFPAMLNMIEPQLTKKNIKLETFIDPSMKAVFCDIRKTKQIMINLLSNAIKYTSGGGVIKVNVLKETDRVKIEVSDSGLGIAKEYQEIIFNEFLQVDRVRDEALGGTGIGLALTRRLVELHGGDIGVHSEEGKGSVFWFTLPDRKSAPSGKPIKGDVTEMEIIYPTGRRILVVEDNEANLAMVVDILSIHEHEVFVAKNGREAIDLALSSQPELILMDIRMPVMDGLQATKEIKNMKETSHIPIIALTASVGEESVEKCKEAGCQDHLAKPVGSKELFDMLQRYL